MLSILDLIMYYGVIALLVWTPLVFGAVHAWAYSLLEVYVFLLLALWMMQRIVMHLQPRVISNVSPALVNTPLAPSLALFLVLLIVQVLPLSPALLSLLSPFTDTLYRLFLPNWPDTHATLSLSPYATRIALGQLLAYAGLFFLLVNTLRSHRRVRFVCWTIVGTACAIALIGIGQRLSGTLSIYWFRDTSYVSSFFGPFINRNHFANYQAMVIPFGFALLLLEPAVTNSETSVYWRRRWFQVFALLSPLRVLLISALAIMTGSLLLSESRGGAVSFFLGLVLFGLLLHMRRIRMGRRSLFAIAMVAMVAMGLWLGMTPLMTRFGLLAADQQASLSLGGRFPAFQAAWKMSRDFPVLGVGYEAFDVVSRHYLPSSVSQPRFVHVHNDFLQLLAETGWIGFVLLVGGILLTLRNAISRWRVRRDPFVQVMVPAGLAALCAAGLHALVEFNLHIPANALLLTTVLALTWSCANLPRRQAYGPREGARVRQPGNLGAAVWPWLGLVAVLGLSFGALRIAIADWYYPQQEVLQPSHWIYRVKPAVKRQRLQQALRWTPDNPRYWVSLAELEAQAAWDLLEDGESREETKPRIFTGLLQALNFYEHALRQQPTEPYTQLGRLRVLQRLAVLDPLSLPPGIEDMSIWYSRVASLAPSDPAIQFELGVLRLAAPADDTGAVTALAFFQQALRLDASYDPQVLRTYLNALPPREALHRFAQSLPNMPEGHLRAARLLEGSYWPLARLHYRTALMLSEFDPAILQEYGTALQRHEDFAAARELQERLLKVRPDDPQAYLQLATTLRRLNDPEATAQREALIAWDMGADAAFEAQIVSEAATAEIQTLERLVERFPRHGDYHAYLAHAYMQAGESVAAETAWKRVLDLQPHSAQGYVGLAHLYASQEEIPAAIRMMQRAVTLSSETVEYHHTLAQLYERHGDRDRALQIYQRLAARRRDDPYALYKLGTYAYQEGKLLSAITYYRRAVVLQPDHVGYRQALDQAVEQSAK